MTSNARGWNRSRIRPEAPLPRSGLPAGRAGSVLRLVLVVAAVVLPALLLLLWDRTPPRHSLVTILLSLALDAVRTAIVVELLGIFLVTLVSALLSRALLSWLAGGLWFGILFVAFLPSRMPPKTLSFEVIDTRVLVIALLGVAALGFAAAGLGAGVGAALRYGLSRLLLLRHGLSRRQLVLLACLVILALPSAYGLSQTSDILLHGPYQNVTRAIVRPPPPTAGPVSPARRLDFTYQSQAFNMQRHAIVFLPAGYDSSPNQRYPVVYLLHGAPGGVNDWVSAEPQQLAAQVHDQGKAPSLIEVLVDGVGPRGGADDSFADGYVPGDNMETDIIGSLIPAIDRQLRTETGPAHRWVGGYSTGGYGAANLSLRHPDLFGVAVVLSVDPLQPPASSFGGNAQAQAANNPLKLAQRAAKPDDPDFWVTWGTADPAAPQSVSFVNALKAHGYKVHADPVNGGHEGSVWKTGLYNALLALGTQLGKPSQ